MCILLFECKKPPIIWTCGGDRQRISSREVSWPVAIRNDSWEYSVLEIRPEISAIVALNVLLTVRLEV